jgi:hypothetical protein
MSWLVSVIIQGKTQIMPVDANGKCMSRWTGERKNCTHKDEHSIYVSCQDNGSGWWVLYDYKRYWYTWVILSITSGVRPSHGKQHADECDNQQQSLQYCMDQGRKCSKKFNGFEC